MLKSINPNKKTQRQIIVNKHI